MANRNRKLNEAMKRTDNMMNSPVTITECVQISRGVAEDVVEDYHRTQGNLQLSISIQLELLRDLVIAKGLTTAEQFRDQYMAKAKEVQELQRKMMNNESPEDDKVTAEMKVTAGDVEVKTEA